MLGLQIKAPSQQQTKNRKNGFSRLVRKNKNKKQKPKHLSEEGTLHSLLQNTLTKKVKVRFEPGSWSDGSTVTKARSRARSWNADDGDEIR